MKKTNNNETILSVLILFLVVGLFCLLYARFVLPAKVSEPQATETPEATEETAIDTPAAVASPSPSPSLSPSLEQTASPELAALQTKLKNYTSSLNGSWSLYFEKLSTGETISCTHGVSESTPMVSASLIKLWVMATVYQQIEAGKLDERDVTKNLTAMITQSDNDATNALIKKLGSGDAAKGMAAVNAFASDAGCSNTALNRLMLANNGKQNYTTARDCAAILQSIYNGDCVSSSASQKMLALLSAQTRKNKIPAGLPDGVKSANKTGELTGLCEGDAAIVFLPDNDYILCVIVAPKDNAAAITQIKKVSQMVYAAEASGQ